MVTKEPTDNLRMATDDTDNHKISPKNSISTNFEPNGVQNLSNQKDHENDIFGTNKKKCDPHTQKFTFDENLLKKRETPSYQLTSKNSLLYTIEQDQSDPLPPSTQDPLNPAPGLSARKFQTQKIEEYTDRTETEDEEDPNEEEKNQFNGGIRGRLR